MKGFYKSKKDYKDIKRESKEKQKLTTQWGL